MREAVADAATLLPEGLGTAAVFVLVVTLAGRAFAFCAAGGFASAAFAAVFLAVADFTVVGFLVAVLRGGDLVAEVFAAGDCLRVALDVEVLPAPPVVAVLVEAVGFLVTAVALLAGADLLVAAVPRVERLEAAVGFAAAGFAGPRRVAAALAVPCFAVPVPAREGLVVSERLAVFPAWVLELPAGAFEAGRLVVDLVAADLVFVAAAFGGAAFAAAALDPEALAGGFLRAAGFRGALAGVGFLAPSLVSSVISMLRCLFRPSHEHPCQKQFHARNFKLKKAH